MWLRPSIPSIFLVLWIHMSCHWIERPLRRVPFKCSMRGRKGWMESLFIYTTQTLRRDCDVRWICWTTDSNLWVFKSLLLLCVPIHFPLSSECGEKKYPRKKEKINQEIAWYNYQVRHEESMNLLQRARSDIFHWFYSEKMRSAKSSNG